MPPKGTSSSRGASRGASKRGRGRGVPVALPVPVGLPAPDTHVTTIGVKRPNFGTAGRAVKITVNSFATTIPNFVICHYDAIIPSESTLPQRVTMDLMNQLQSIVAPEIFTPPVVYDGRKNVYAARELSLGQNSREFDVILPDASYDPAHPNRAPKVYKIRLTKVAEINPEVLQRFIEGHQAHDNSVTTASQALNVVIRMEPIQRRLPFNVRSFFTDQEFQSLGSGLEVWRGYFQSVRPGIGRMFINIDISTGMMYKSGRLTDLALEFFNKGKNPNILDPTRGLPPTERLRLSKFIQGMRIETRPPGSYINDRIISRTVKKVTEAGANRLFFTLRDGENITVAEYYRRQNQQLNHPSILCVEVGSGALIPFELCHVPKGQIIRKQIPANKTREVLEFASKKPQERLQSITQGITTLNYGQSDYVRQFGMNVDTSGPMSVDARVLKPPLLEYGGKQTITPKDGSWNMVDKKFYKPALIRHWVMVIFEKRCSSEDATRMAQDLVRACQVAGMTVINPKPVVISGNPQGKIALDIRQAGAECKRVNGELPNLIVVVLPENANDIYQAIKHFGDCVAGVASQCLQGAKCLRAKDQYWTNVALKINPKLGGINVIPSQLAALVDPNKPTIIMGADVIHPAPGSQGRPSFTALVANLDSNAATYAATTRVQASRQEIISDLNDMVQAVVKQYFKYQRNVNKHVKPIARIIFYRDGVSEGQFQQVLDQELPALKAACAALEIKPKITMIIVGKRHHMRLFPQNARDADKSGNCPAGTVVDTGIAHPTEFDFYLQSHSGILGTSRSAHYSVLHDENNFTADNLQALSFALCHTYARSTRSVSIPAPVYYADLVCARARNHYDPEGAHRVDDSETVRSDDGSPQTLYSLESFKSNFKPIHSNHEDKMYFS